MLDDEVWKTCATTIIYEIKTLDLAVLKPRFDFIYYIN